MHILGLEDPLVRFVDNELERIDEVLANCRLVIPTIVVRDCQAGIHQLPVVREFLVNMIDECVCLCWLP